MSSVNYGNEGLPSTDETTNPSGAIIQHPYLNTNAYAAAAVVAAASSPATAGQYQHYYGHPLPPQQLLHVQQTAGFYPPTTSLNHHQHHGEFSNSSPSVASSSSSIESSRKPNTRKRNAAGSEKLPGTTASNKGNTKRKMNDEDLDDDDDDEENKCYLRGAPLPNAMMSNNHLHGGASVGGDEDKEKQARENHCEIERRRRIKMATYFGELCDMVPACSNLARKPDKLTILRMAAQFMKTLRTNNNSLLSQMPTQQPQQQSDLHKPSFLNDQELKYLMVESCDAFLFALNCENLRLIYVSDAIQHILSYTCQDWYSRCFFDFVHPDDIEKVREQLNLQPQDGSPNGNGSGRVLDLRTGTVKKEGHATGARLVSSKRSFICRLRIGSTNPLDQSHQNPFINPCILRRRHRTPLGPSNDGHLYEVVHISGYIRNLTTHHHPSSHHDNPSSSSSSSNSAGQMAFIAIVRIQNSCSPNINDLTNGSMSSLNSHTTEFTCRCHSETGEILFIDQRCTSVIGYKSQELLHKLIVDQIHPDDQMKFQDLYKRTVTQKNLSTTSANLTNIIVRVRTNMDNEYVSLKTSTYAFSNPCTDEIEFLIVTFLSNQTTNKTSVIANANDYNRPTYETYPRNSSAIVPRYPTQSPSTTYTNQEGQEYSTGNANHDGRTYASNNGGSTWAAANDSWTTGNTTTPTTTTTTDYVDPTIYHQYHQ